MFQILKMVFFMKKDKEKAQPVSSAALTLQLLNKQKERDMEAEEKESANESAKVRCRTCFKEVAPNRLCSGHVNAGAGGGGGGAGGGAGGGGGGSATSGKTEEKVSPGGDNKPHKVLENSYKMIDGFGSVGLNSGSLFEPEIIAALIAKGLLLVESDRESMALTIKLLCEPNELTEEQREELTKFTEAILKEFNAFKEDNHLSDDCMKITHDEKGNILSLQITMPTLALYDAFIQRLSNNLIPSPKAQERDEFTKDQSPAPNQFSMVSKSSNENNPTKQEEIEPDKDIEPNRKEDEEEEEEEKQESFNPSPLNMKPW